MTGFETLSFERTYAAPLPRLWHAWTAPEARAIWSPPNAKTGIEILETDTRTGGRETSICRAPGMPDIRCDLGWVVVEDQRRTVNTEVLSVAAEAMSAAIVTAEFVGDNRRATLRITIQLASLQTDMAGGYREGYGAALENIARYLG